MGGSNYRARLSTMDAHHILPLPLSAEAAAAEKKVFLGRPSNNLQMGIVGVPNVGKSSLFNALSKCGTSCPPCVCTSSEEHQLIRFLSQTLERSPTSPSALRVNLYTVSKILIFFCSATIEPEEGE